MENLKYITRRMFVAVLLGGSAAACGGGVDQLAVLKEKCSNNDTQLIDDVAVAQTVILLRNSSEATLGRAKILAIAPGHITISRANELTAGVKFEIQQNGQSAVELIDGTVFDKKKLVAFTATAVDSGTRVTLTLNCTDPSKMPPEVRAAKGLSPDRHGTKAAMASYKGFGIK